MAESTNNTGRGTTVGSSNNFLYFIVGGLVAVVAIGFFVMQGGHFGSAKAPAEQAAPAAPAAAPATTPPAASTSN